MTRLSNWIRRSSQKAHPVIVLAAGALLLFSLDAVRKWVKQEAAARRADLEALQDPQEQTLLALNEFRSLEEFKSRDLAQFEKGLSGLAKSKRSLYEAGLSLQEEKRLLEKQWEIITTYLTLDLEDKKIALMRGDQPLESYSISYAPPKAFGVESKSLPPIVQIISKERFAYPEKGKFEQVNGILQWEPPQMGTSVRANALGEFVMFTNSGLILHGPPKKKAEHEEFPHLCLGLSLSTARKLYENSFIGTKILLKASPAKAPSE